MAKLKKILNKKRIRIIMFIILDVLALTLCSFLALALRLDFHLEQNYINNIYKYLFTDSLILICIFSIFRLYKSMWSYASINETINIIISCSIYEIISFLYKQILEVNLPRSFYIIELFLLYIFIGAIRYSYRIARVIKDYYHEKSGLTNTMIIGAGEAGRMLITEIYNNKVNFNNKICCIIDDDKNKIGSYIKNIPVVGNREYIEKAVENYNIEEIIIAMPSIGRENLNIIIDECQKTNCTIKTLPGLNELVGKPTMKKVRPLSYEDFLGRKEIVVDLKEISKSLCNKVILVTGGGGSIGSELCRQIAKCQPEELIIFDIYENNAYDIEQELLRNYPKLNLKTIIGSVRDYARVESIFKEYHPEYVFHAAAHKHVPLMEASPNEAIKNNCLGTLNVVKLADIYKVKKFVLISSDKAVRPTNVMGATKRICEMIIQTYNKKSKTDYVAVRFGNVLGSNGSVIPLFLKQIEEGGPVTVTHKDITRFFMTIPEAVSLILQAFVYAEGGEIFVLDMGKPIKIYDLAKKIIRFKGYEPFTEMPIKITGLRPGEKLYEELLMDEEGLKETPNKLIHIGKPIEMNEKKFLNDLEKLIEYSYKNNKDIKERIAKIVETYKIDKREKE
ncbi:MAG: nucleoside-diphosphate sugar epimerase/dehydratase [Mycoplasmatota bacterium]|nr:nucleoside-diphosphate sugar epimerase/dehydratase [Mycoplasmatota bacterium]